jgi:hypothetical protein
MRKKIRYIAIILSILVILGMLTGCQDELLDGSELDMSKLGPNEKYVKANTIYKSLRRGEEYLDAKYEYDKYGNVVKKIDYNKNGEVIKEYTWKYDKQGNVLEEIREGNDFSLRFVYRYNDKNQRIKWRTQTKSGRNIKGADYRYWDNGNLKYRKRMNYFDLGEIEEINYNEQGEPINGKITTPNGEEIKIEYIIKRYKNNKRKKQIRKEIYNGETVASTITEYNKEGQKVKSVSNGRRINTWYEWQYDDRGNIIKFTVKDEDGKVEEWEEYKYNDNGNKIEEKEYEVKENEKVELYFWTVENYDKNGNHLSWHVKSEKGKIISIGKNEFKKIEVIN